MKAYANGMKATDTSRKQVSVIFAKAKCGELKVENWVISLLYKHAEFYNFDHNGSVELEERTFVKPLVDAVFGGRIEDAQSIIDDFTENLEKNYSTKFVRNADRNLVD